MYDYLFVLMARVLYINSYGLSFNYIFFLFRLLNYPVILFHFIFPQLVSRVHHPVTEEILPCVPLLFPFFIFLLCPHILASLFTSTNRSVNIILSWFFIDGYHVSIYPHPFLHSMQIEDFRPFLVTHFTQFWIYSRSIRLDPSNQFSLSSHVRRAAGGYRIKSTIFASNISSWIS